MEHSFRDRYSTTSLSATKNILITQTILPMKSRHVMTNLTMVHLVIDFLVIAPPLFRDIVMALTKLKTVIAIAYTNKIIENIPRSLASNIRVYTVFGVTDTPSDFRWQLKSQ